MLMRNYWNQCTESDLLSCRVVQSRRAPPVCGS